MQLLKFFMEVQGLVGMRYSTTKLVMCTGLTCQGITYGGTLYHLWAQTCLYFPYERLAKGKCPE